MSFFSLFLSLLFFVFFVLPLFLFGNLFYYLNFTFISGLRSFIGLHFVRRLLFFVLFQFSCVVLYQHFPIVQGSSPVSDFVFILVFINLSLIEWKLGPSIFNHFSNLFGLKFPFSLERNEHFSIEPQISILNRLFMGYLFIFIH